MRIGIIIFYHCTSIQDRYNSQWVLSYFPRHQSTIEDKEFSLRLQGRQVHMMPLEPNMKDKVLRMR